MQLKTRWEQGSNLLMHCYHIASYGEDLFLCAVLIGTAEVRFAIAGGSFFFLQKAGVIEFSVLFGWS